MGHCVMGHTACKPLPALLRGHPLPALTNDYALWRNDRGAAAASVSGVPDG